MNAFSKLRRGRLSRNLVVLSDGTGNSAAKSAKTNVWRLYQALDLTDGQQVAVFGDGAGTSSVKVLRVLSLVLGVGVKRNVLNLYNFLCRNYGENDRIWAFSSVAAPYTIRVLVGLIDRAGLVTYEAGPELGVTRSRHTGHSARRRSRRGSPGYGQAAICVTG